MKLHEAVREFDDWSRPWTFESKIKEGFLDDPEEIAKFEAISDEANKREHWLQGDLTIGCKITHNELRKRFPDEDEETLAAFVRSASYNWK